ncbi:MAG: type II toxin-antitoxin system HicB family antitoxin [Dysgonomonas sp.]|nr:type II toxin-antitoxin system HicB family antitoxin [Dysgonomonas sp.]
MTTKKIKAVIERASDGGYGIYCPELEGISLFGYGATEDEAKSDLKDNLEIFLEHYEQKGTQAPEVLNAGNITFDYKYDFSGFFKTYPIFNVSELAKEININSSLLRRYKQGLALASPEQKKKIEAGIHDLAKRLTSVRF